MFYTIVGINGVMKAKGKIVDWISDKAELIGISKVAIMQDIQLKLMIKFIN